MAKENEQGAELFQEIRRIELRSRELVERAEEIEAQGEPELAEPLYREALRFKSWFSSRPS